MYYNERRDDCVNGLGNHLETVLVILVKKMCSHECEYWHDVVKNTVLREMYMYMYKCDCRKYPLRDNLYNVIHVSGVEGCV